MGKKEIIKAIRTCFDNGGKLIIFGNGGSMAEASHMAAEFVGIGLPAISLSDPSMITALANDYGYNKVFEKWIYAIAQPWDLAIGISSSGKSENVNKGLNLGVYMHGLEVLDFPRKGKTTSQIQNNQLKLIHEIYEAFI